MEVTNTLIDIIETAHMIWSHEKNARRNMAKKNMAHQREENQEYPENRRMFI